jgi:hypothetical protein
MLLNFFLCVYFPGAKQSVEIQCSVVPRLRGREVDDYQVWFNPHKVMFGTAAPTFILI